jgi:hypothetical protein
MDAYIELMTHAKKTGPILRFDRPDEPAQLAPEPPKPMDAAAVRRERRAQRRDARAAHKARLNAMVEADEEPAAVEFPLFAPGPLRVAPAAIPPNIMVREGRVQLPAAPARGAQRRMGDADPAFKNMAQERKVEIFWDVITRLNWRNASEGFVAPATVQGVIDGLADAAKRAFHEIYTLYCDTLMGILNADGMFARNRVNGYTDRVKIVSHVVGLGKDTYETLSADLAFLQILVEMGECQSLDAALPEDVRMA